MTTIKANPVYFADQILPGTFEHALNHIVDNELDLSIFLDRYKNDETGVSAFDPAILLKMILFAYSHWMTSSRKIEAACRNNKEQKEKPRRLRKRQTRSEKRKHFE